MEGNTTQSTQTNLANLNSNVKKLISKLKSKYPTAEISVTDNYKWLHRDDLRGTYTLSSTTKDDTIMASLTKDIEIIRKISEK